MTLRELVYIRVAIMIALIAFTAAVVIFGNHWVWGTIGFIMALIASVAPVKVPE